MEKQTLKGPGGIRLHLDPGEIFPDDPGNGTPALVELHGQWATLNCALGEEFVEDWGLSPQQLKWLEDMDATIVEEMYRSR